MATWTIRLRARWRSPPAALLLVALAASVAAAPPPANTRVLPADASGRPNGDPYRLPRSVLPEQYTLHLEPDLENKKFTGRVEIVVEAQAATDTITLHAEGIDFGDVTVFRQETEENIYEDSVFNSTYEQVDLLLTEELEANKKYDIVINYEGTLRDNMNGFYISTYFADGDTHTLAATQFQPTHARKAFPCFDEPSFKARFKVSVRAPPGYRALGNMPLADGDDGDVNEDGKTFEFQNSMVMSSYLVAFVVSKFEWREDKRGDDKEIFRTWARANALDGTEYSLEVSRPMLRVLEDFTGIPYTDEKLEYPLNKVDQVALPDFSAGAMENWGLITYRETNLLYNGGPAAAKKRVATTIAHELLHMWFGNLITTYWWDTTWLNEGFARYFQYYVTDKVESDWRMWDQFLVDQHHSVFALDALVTANALTHYVSTPSQVSGRFGTITYNKGGSVLRMIRHIVGEDKFQSALRNYLSNKKYEAVEPKDFFDALMPFAPDAQLSEDQLLEFLKSWTEQPGYPVVNVCRYYDTNDASVYQFRFLLKGESDLQYVVPITWTYDGGSFETTTPSHYLVKHAYLDITDMPSKDKWVIFNVQQTGYYRVNYDSENWNLIINHLKDWNKSIYDIHHLNRAQLLDDAFNLARADLLSYNIVFDLADYLSRETDYVPWAAALTAFSYLDRMLVNHEKYAVFQRYVLRLIDKAFQNYNIFFYLNNAPDSHDDKLLFNRLITWACSLGHEMCGFRTANALQRHLYEDIPANQDQRSVVYCNGIRNARTSEWNRLWQLYTESLDDTDRALMLAGLGCSRDESRLQLLLEHSISGEHIRKQDASSAFSAVYTNPDGLEVALQFLNDNFMKILDYYGSMGSINSIVTGIAGRLTTPAQREKLEAFIETYPDDLVDIGDTALATVDDNLQWLQSHVDEIFGILESKELLQYRLPHSVKPLHYDLHLHPELSFQRFNGRVSIRVTAEEATDTIVLHAQGVTASTLSVKLVGSTEEIYKAESSDIRHELLKLYLTRPLVPKSNYIIDISFYGTLRDNMYGFYISKYINEEGKEISIAATQFQPTHARKAFPCFDEPGFKSTFTVTITTPPNYSALGNMPVSGSQLREDGSTDVTFHTTPLMSTYLLAFVVSNFVYLEEETVEEVQFKTWARSNAIEWAKYSIQISNPILKSLEDYTNIKYTDPTLEHPFDKVDQVALPDFSAGAMENWGLVTYRETALLYNDGTAAARKSVATIIAHELAHMWFGNLVTTHWWDTTWLNEGFAQYFQYFITDKVNPDWRLMDQFVFDTLQGVMASDALASASPLTSPAYTPSQISGRFSGITYSKGASILRMLSAMMGEENFQDALRTYLEKYRYSTTIPEYLFQELVRKASAANLNTQTFENLLHSWTLQPGFPVITVERNYAAYSATVSQRRFLLKVPATPDTRLYYVPLTWVAQGGDFSVSPPRNYITNQQTSITIQNLPVQSQWVIFNIQETGFYRVNYDPANWRLLSNHLRDHTKPLDDIHVLNRAQLLDDAFNLARAGQLPYETAFYLSDYLRRETDYVPWASALAAFSYLQRMLIFNDRYEDFEMYVRHLIEVQYNFFSFEDREGHIDKLLLNRISLWACSVRLPDCINRASAGLRNFLDQRIPVPADLRTVVYCYGIRHSETRYWDLLLQEYQRSLDSAERALLMAGLACSHDEEKLSELLQHSISDTFIRRQDASSVFTSVYSNTKGLEVTLDFLDENFDAVEEYYGSMGVINNIVVGIAGRMTTEPQKTKLEDFVTRHDSKLGATGHAALETVNENLLWLDVHEKSIRDTLDRELVTFPPDITTTSEATTQEVTDTPEPGTESPTTTELPTTTQGAGALRAAALAVLLLPLIGRLL